MEILVFLLAVLGSVYIICESEIGSGIRNKLDDSDNIIVEFISDLITCPRCTSFWVGWIGGILSFGSICLVYPLMSVGFVHIVYSLFENLEDLIKCLIK
jgi:hypothetical protein